MFSGFFGKDKKATDAPAKDAVDSRGLEVIEDDPETAWGLWDSALAEQESRFNVGDSANAVQGTTAAVATDEVAPLPPLSLTLAEMEAPTEPMALVDQSPAQRRDDALRVVEAHHQRIANTIRTLWGYKECSVYIYKLIMNGDDGMGHARAGFNQEAVDSMLALADLHDKEFGAHNDGQSGFSDTTMGASFGRVR